ncbi:MAG TPA: hypothetical protein VK977_05195 [Actinomycetota bacterium]|nr:hypothetical protein [Actinomycetota bacterium]
MDLWLAPEERDLLERVLTRSLSDLLREIAETHSYRYRMRLHRDEEALRAIMRKLRPAAASGVWSDEVGIDELATAA